MTIDTIIMADPSQPIEIQNWFDTHPDIVTVKVLVNSNIVYMIY